MPVLKFQVREPKRLLLWRKKQVLRKFATRNEFLLRAFLSRLAKIWAFRAQQLKMAVVAVKLSPVWRQVLLF